MWKDESVELPILFSNVIDRMMRQALIDYPGVELNLDDVLVEFIIIIVQR